jgi:Predicted Fe-S oxidoreductases
MPMKNCTLDELSFDGWKEIINILKDNGTIFLTLIGGEVLLNKDFLDIYEYAYKNNFKIEIGTNGSILNDYQVIETLSRFKPLQMDITLYGASNETYKTFTGISNGWDIVSGNVINMVNNGINVKLKTIGNTINRDEIILMKQFADKLKLDFTFYSKMNCYTDGDSTPKKFQLNHSEILDVMINLGIIDEYINHIKNSNYYSESGIKKCSAGINKCYIDPYGFMFLCNGSQENKYSIKKCGFNYCWEQIWIERQNKIEIVTTCGKCKNRNICGICAPKIKNEYKSIEQKLDECKYGEYIQKELLK